MDGWKVTESKVFMWVLCKYKTAYFIVFVKCNRNHWHPQNFLQSLISSYIRCLHFRTQYVDGKVFIYSVTLYPDIIYIRITFLLDLIYYNSLEITIYVSECLSLNLPSWKWKIRTVQMCCLYVPCINTVKFRMESHF